MPMAQDIQPRIALLIDADNAPADMIDGILTELSTYGVINIRRAYGNWTKPGLSGWQAKLLEFALRPMQQFDYSKRKNATDMAMTVDAMELLYTENPDAFGIVSSDADFTPLVMHLRAKGAAVYGFGMAQTPKPFVNACSRFLYLESLAGEDESVPLPSMAHDAEDKAEAEQQAQVSPDLPSQGKVEEIPAPGVPAKPATQRVPTAQLRQDTHLMNLLRHAVQASCDEGGWARVSALRAQIGNKTSFDARNYGYATLTKLLAATEAFDFQAEGTPHVAVRHQGKVSQAGRPPAESVAPGATQVNDVISWPSASSRQASRPLSVALHGLRSALLQVAARRVRREDVLQAVPELVFGAPCALSSVAGRLREKGLLLRSQSALRVLEQYPKTFIVSLDRTPQSVRYVRGHSS